MIGEARSSSVQGLSPTDAFWRTTTPGRTIARTPHVCPPEAGKHEGYGASSERRI